MPFLLLKLIGGQPQTPCPGFSPVLEVTLDERLFQWRRSLSEITQDEWGRQ